MESLQSQTTEFQFQIRELNQRNALLTDELAEARKEAERTDSGPDISAEEVAQLLSNTEVKYEARLADLRRQLDAVEQERNDADADWSLKFSTKVNEVEELKKAISSSTRTKIDHEQLVLQFRNEIEQLKDTIRKYEKKSLDLQRQAETVRDVEVSVIDSFLSALMGYYVGYRADAACRSEW
jgi:chromosome segregation ATPase